MSASGSDPAQFQLGEQLVCAPDFTGRLEAIFIDHESAYEAQIAWRRVRLRYTLAPPPAGKQREPRVGETPTHWAIHLFLVAPGRRLGAFVPESAVHRAPGRPGAITVPRYSLGQWLTEHYGDQVMVSAIYRRFSSAVDAGIVSRDWFDAQERRPATRMQPFYGCGGMLVGEAEARPLPATRRPARR